MRLFKRHKSEQKSEPRTSDDSLKTRGGVFRLFHSGGGSSVPGSKELSQQQSQAMLTQPTSSLLDDDFEPTASKRAVAAAAAAAAAVAEAEAVDAAAAAAYSAADTDQTGDSSPANCNSINQNYTPEADSLTTLPRVLPNRRLTDSHNTGDMSANADTKAKELSRFQRWQQKKPRFHFGPRGDRGEDEGDTEKRGSVSASSGSENIITLPPKYAFIYQDGKFVEREVTRWQKPVRVTPHLRYRNLEPFATHYGRRYRRRLDSEERIVSIRHRLIYQNPIYRLPRRIMEENKSRLMTRHSLKDSFEGSKKVGGPQLVEIGEREQSKMNKKYQDKYNHMEAEKLVNYISMKKSHAVKADKA